MRFQPWMKIPYIRTLTLQPHQPAPRSVRPPPIQNSPKLPVTYLAYTRLHANSPSKFSPLPPASPNPATSRSFAQARQIPRNFNNIHLNSHILAHLTTRGQPASGFAQLDRDFNPGRRACRNRSDIGQKIGVVPEPIPEGFLDW